MRSSSASSSRSSSRTARSASRRSRPASSTGVVTDANDGEPIAGATVTAQPGGRDGTTAETGTYTLRLLPGSYTLTASADLYSRPPAPADRRRRRRADASTSRSSASIALGRPDRDHRRPSTTARSTTVDGHASRTAAPADLTWEARRSAPGRRHSRRSAGGVRHPQATVWGRARPARMPARRHRRARHHARPTCRSIIDDPVGDSTGCVDVDAVRGGSDGSNVVAVMALDFSRRHADRPGRRLRLPRHRPGPDTGVPAEGFSGLPTQDVGVEYFSTSSGPTTRIRSSSSSTPRLRDRRRSVPATLRGPVAALRHPARGHRRR